jgi:hypothetical protein
MVRAARREQPSILFLGSLLLIGGLTLGSGVKAFLNLEQVYRPDDIAYSESNQTFLDQRRALVHALLSDPFLKTMWNDDRDRRGTLGALLGGVLQALASSPLEGDLWLAAARLRRSLMGFDEEGERYLTASFRYTPREVDLVIDRLFLARGEASRNSPLPSHA